MPFPRAAAVCPVAEKTGVSTCPRADQETTGSCSWTSRGAFLIFASKASFWSVLKLSRERMNHHQLQPTAFPLLNMVDRLLLFDNGRLGR